MTSQAWVPLALPTGDANLSTFSKTVTYNFPAAGANNGQLVSMSDGAGGETVAYQYDALKRLISAVATPNAGASPTAWTETYGYDGFGNLTSKSLNGAAGAISVDPATNRLDVQSIRYDANGNLYAGTGGLAMTYDESNRLASARPGGGSNPVEYYGYAPDNKRLLRVKTDGSEEWTLYGARGEKLGVYALTGPTAIYNPYTGQWTGQTAAFAAVKTNVWFDGRLVAEGVTASLPGGNPVFQDRLGTNRASGARFRPYGEEISSTANDRVKFGTYTRDGFSGLDYADQRFYASSDGRFNTADPYRASAGAGDPGSWNRYAYVGGDPVNFNDASGLARCWIDHYVTDGTTTAYINCVSNGGSQSGEGTSTLHGPVLPGGDLTADDLNAVASAKESWGAELDRREQAYWLAAAGQLALSALRAPECASLYHGSDPSRVLSGLLAGGSGGAVSYGDLGGPQAGFITAAATTGVLGRGAEGQSAFTGANITINSNAGGPWIQGYPNPTGIPQSIHRAITLLHELGHVFNIVTGMGGSSLNNNDSVTDADGNRVSAGTDRTLLEKCFPNSIR